MSEHETGERSFEAGHQEFERTDGGFDADQPEGVPQELQEEAVEAVEEGRTRHEHVSEEVTGQAPELDADQ